jgi:sirohydrochlorin ferrochelatase
MEAVLYVGHGSRVKAGANEAISFIERTQPRIDVPIQEICFLELVEPNISEGIDRCVQRGATKIAVVPILLLTANHANEDIPLELNEGKKKYPQVEITYGRPFGVHPKIVDSLYDRIIEQGKPIKKDSRVLLVGRGSSDQAVEQDLNEIARLLGEKYFFRQVETCFLYGTGKSFESALEDLQKHTSQVFIIPYLLFTGILLKGIEKQLAAYSNNEQQLILCKSLGYDHHVQDVLVERVGELISKEG